MGICIEELQTESSRQTNRGRLGKHTQYQRQEQTRYDIRWILLQQQLDQVAETDGAFPLITNIRDWSASEILQAYKRQPCIEKRFSQCKNDFRVAPVYLKSIARIVGLLAIYFFALMVQALLERELRNAMAAQQLEQLKADKSIEFEKLQIERYKAETDRMKAEADMAKAGATIDKTYSDIRNGAKAGRSNSPD